MEFSQRYHNAEERDVHVWASVLSNTGRRFLVAGCWTDARLTVQTFYAWLAEIVHVDPSISHLPFVLVRISTSALCNQYETIAVASFNATVTNCIATGAFIMRNSTAILQPGHYLLFELNPQGILTRVLPRLREPVITSRTVTRGATGTGTPKSRRSQTVRTHVRNRDGQCRVTGAGAPARERGPNFKGLQVAHIYPLAYWAKSQNLLTTMTRDVLRHNNAKGDVPQNAMVMKSDIHDQFDDYQFGFWRENGAHFYYRFERSGAPSIGVAQLGMGLGPAGAANVPDVLDELWKNHFITALLWHVRGFGRAIGQ